jgi:membrane protein
MPAQQGKPQQYLRSLHVFLVRAYAEFRHDECLTRAASLAFASLLALVPLTALLFSLFSSLGGFTEVLDRLQAFLITQLLPASQQEVMISVARFVENTKALGVVGLLFFLLTSVFLLNTIQSTFNVVWGGGGGRLSLRRLATYASVLIVGSFVFSIGLNLTGMLRPLLDSAALAELSRSMTFLLGVFPSLFIFCALLLMILFIPSGRVRFPGALLGAAAGAVLWEIARRIFYFWVTSVIRLSIVYGSLAALPIFLIWLYVAWAIVLFSLETAYLHQHRYLVRLGKPLGQAGPAERLLFGLDVYMTIAGRFHQGQSPPSLEQVAARLAVSAADVARVVDVFLQDRLLITAGEGGRQLLPARSLEKIQLRTLFDSLFGPNAGAAATPQAEALFATARREVLESMDELTLLEFLKDNRVLAARVEGSPGRGPAESRGLSAVGRWLRSLLPGRRGIRRDARAGERPAAAGAQEGKEKKSSG